MFRKPHEPIQGLILDMDGVLWRDAEPLVDLPAAFAAMQARGWQVYLATNNATNSVDGYIEKLGGMGVHLQAQQVINSGLAAAYYLKQRFPAGGRVFIVGAPALVETLAEAGFYASDADVLAVVACLDRQLTYQKLTQAALLIRAGAEFIGTNPDRTFPTPQGLVPGTGAILAALESATDVAPVIVGKPSPFMYQAAMQRMRLPAANVLVVGDRLETDIAGAQAIGCQTGLVLSGVTSAEQAALWLQAPDWIASDLTELLQIL